MAKKDKPQANRQRVEIDITPNLPTEYDPFKPWPYTIPDPRPVPYGKPGKRVRVLILPGRIEYDPAMHKVEAKVRRLMNNGHDVVIVVPDIWRGVGEIMARRNGLNFMVVNCDIAGNTCLPSTYGFDTWLKSKTARRRVLREADMVYVIDNHIGRDLVSKDIDDHFPNLVMRVFKHMYVKKERAVPVAPPTKEEVRKKIKDSDKKTKKKKKRNK